MFRKFFKKSNNVMFAIGGGIIILGSIFIYNKYVKEYNEDELMKDIEKLFGDHPEASVAKIILGRDDTNWWINVTFYDKSLKRIFDVREISNGRNISEQLKNKLLDSPYWVM